MKKNSGSKRDFLSAVKLGIVFCLAQILICLVIAPKSGGLKATYLRLVQWDSYHYMDIAEKGYHLPPGPLSPEDVHSNRANVGYFPAYPAFIQMVHQAGFSIPISALIVAQVACFIFWVLTFLLLGFWKFSVQESVFVAITICLFPASFFLVAGYTESLFMASLIGSILGLEVWMSRGGGKYLNLSGILAGVSGFILSATRLVGIPLAALPLIKRCTDQNKLNLKRINFSSLFLCLVFVSGGLSFFVWCYFKFGKWDLYLKLQKLGWGNEPDYLALLYPSSYLPRLFFEDTTTSVCRASNLFIVSLIVWLFRRGSWKSGKMKWDILFAAISMFFISISGKANYSMDSMVRYNFPVFVLLVLLIISTLDRREWFEPLFQSRFKWKRVYWVLGYLLALVVQIWMIRVFTKGGWVA